MKGKLIFGFLCWFNTVILSAQRYTGYGRGYDVDDDISRGDSSWKTFIFWIVVLVIIAVIVFIYAFIKEKYGKRDWSFDEFDCKHSLRPKIITREDQVIALVYEGSIGSDTVVYLDNQCGFYYDYSDIKY